MPIRSTFQNVASDAKWLRRVRLWTTSHPHRAAGSRLSLAIRSKRKGLSDEPRSPETPDGRLTAGVRLALALMTLLVAAVDPFEADELPPLEALIVAVIVAYVAYAIVAYVAVLRRGASAATLALNYSVDAGAFLLLISLAGATSHSISYLTIFLFLFAAMIASFGSGAGAGLRLTMITAGLFSAAMLGRALLTDDFEPLRAFLRLTYILGLGMMAARWGGHQLTLQRRLALLAEAGPLSNPRFGAERTIGTLLARLRGFYDADACLLVMNTAEDQRWRLYRCERHRRDNEADESSAAAPSSEVWQNWPPSSVSLIRRRDCESWPHSSIRHHSRDEISRKSPPGSPLCSRRW